MKRIRKATVLAVLAACLLLSAACGNSKNSNKNPADMSSNPANVTESSSSTDYVVVNQDDSEPMPEAPGSYEGPEDTPSDESGITYEGFDFASIPEYSGQAVIEINHDEPFFTNEEKVFNGTFIRLSELDALGRCGVAYGCLGQETEPKDDREDISKVKPSGWNQQKLSSGEWLYNRSHLLMFALTGLNDDERNLITGTSNFNQSKSEGMQAWETTAKYVVDNYNGHVLYRVTPVYDGNNLVAKGVLMEAYCIEYPEECTFNRFVYNVQPGVVINYATGEATEQ